MENKISLQQYKDNMKKRTICYDISNISPKYGLDLLMTFFMEHQTDTSIVLMAEDKEGKHLLVETIIKETVFGNPSALMEEENIGIYLHSQEIDIETVDGKKMIDDGKEKYIKKISYGGFFNLKNQKLFLYQQENNRRRTSILHRMKNECFGEKWIVDLERAFDQTIISKNEVNQQMAGSYKIMEEIEEYVVRKNREKLQALLYGTPLKEMKQEDRELRFKLREKYEEIFTNIYKFRLTKIEEEKRQKGTLSFLQFLKKMYMVWSEKQILNDISKFYDYITQKEKKALEEENSYHDHILMEEDKRKIITYLLCECNNQKEQEQYVEQTKKEYVEKFYQHMPLEFLLKASTNILLHYDIETIEKDMLTEDEVAFIKISDAIHNYKKIDFMKDPIIDIDIHTKNIFHQDEIDSIHAKILMDHINRLDVQRDDVEVMAQNGISIKNTFSNCVQSFLVYDGNSYQSMLDNENMKETCLDGIPWRDISSMRICDAGKTTLLYTNERSLARYQEYKRAKKEKGEPFFHGEHVRYDDLMETIQKIVSFDKEVERVIPYKERNTKKYKTDVIGRIYFEPNALPLVKMFFISKHQLPEELPVEIPKRSMGILGLAMREEDIKALAEEMFQNKKDKGSEDKVDKVERRNTILIRLPMEKDEYIAMATVVLKPKREQNEKDEKHETPLPVERIFVNIQRNL